MPGGGGTGVCAVAASALSERSAAKTASFDKVRGKVRTFGSNLNGLRARPRTGRENTQICDERNPPLLRPVNCATHKKLQGRANTSCGNKLNGSIGESPVLRLKRKITEVLGGRSRSAVNLRR